jgi:hypothetical protein
MTEGIVVIVQVGARSVNLVDAHFQQSTRRVEILCSNNRTTTLSRTAPSLFRLQVPVRTLKKYEEIFSNPQAADDAIRTGHDRANSGICMG